MKKYSQISKHLPPTLHFFPNQVHSRFSVRPSPVWCRGTGNGGVVSSSQVVSAVPPRYIPLLQRRVPPQEIVLHELLKHESFPQAAGLHKWFLHESLS